MNEKGEGMDMKNVEMRGRTWDKKSDTKDSQLTIMQRALVVLAICYKPFLTEDHTIMRLS